MMPSIAASPPTHPILAQELEEEKFEVPEFKDCPNESVAGKVCNRILGKLNGDELECMLENIESYCPHGIPMSSGCSGSGIDFALADVLMSKLQEHWDMRVDATVDPKYVCEVSEAKTEWLSEVVLSKLDPQGVCCCFKDISALSGEKSRC
eukprot:1530389-Karenia_brevis.AAC.1